ncbi:uncharacterized protein [Centruroides vittatus]|uniref:uncharacterized protein n=1 Tax=Centruroides vittatus TaxID=120091 RepID=UPI00350FFD69
MNNSLFIQGHSSTSFQVKDSCINSDENLKHGYSYYAHNEQNLERFQPSFPPKTSYSSTSQHLTSSIKGPNDYFTDSYDGARKQSEFPLASSNTPVSTSCTYATNSIKPSTDNFSNFTINKTKVQKSVSLLAEVSDQSSLQLNSHTENKSSWFPRERLLKTRPKNDWKPLGVNFMEERNFKLGIIPGKFYDTSNGVLVEMKNGKNYTIFLVNDNKEQCDVDVFVDTHIVAKLRLDGNSTEYLEGPRYDTMKFMFVRARDAPPEAEIMYNDEGNGLIEVIFKPEKKNTVNRKLRERAWSADSNGPFLRTLNETLGNLYGPKEDENFDGTDNRFRSSSYCAGATALQGKQKDRYAELVNDIEIDESRIVVLQLRLVARTDDSSQPETDEPIKPLITKRPPPLPL